MEFTFIFLRVFFQDLVYAGPILIFLVLLIIVMGHVIGRIEGWSSADALYHAFINATTVGYGDLRPTKKSSKTLAPQAAIRRLIESGPRLFDFRLEMDDHVYCWGPQYPRTFPVSLTTLHSLSLM